MISFSHLMSNGRRRPRGRLVVLGANGDPDAGMWMPITLGDRGPGLPTVHPAAPRPHRPGRALQRPDLGAVLATLMQRNDLWPFDVLKTLRPW
jgi:hypothetical protein